MRIGIGDDAQVTEFFLQADVGDVTHPELTGMREVFDFTDKVWIFFVGMIAVGGVWFSASVTKQVAVFTQQLIQRVSAYFDAVCSEFFPQHEVQLGHSRSR